MHDDPRVVDLSCILRQMQLFPAAKVALSLVLWILGQFAFPLSACREGRHFGLE